MCGAGVGVEKGSWAGCGLGVTSWVYGNVSVGRESLHWAGWGRGQVGADPWRLVAARLGRVPLRAVLNGHGGRQAGPCRSRAAERRRKVRSAPVRGRCRWRAG